MHQRWGSTYELQWLLLLLDVNYVPIMPRIRGFVTEGILQYRDDETLAYFMSLGRITIMTNCVFKLVM